MYLETLLVSHCWVVHSFGLFCTVSGYDRGKHPPPPDLTLAALRHTYRRAQQWTEWSHPSHLCQHPRFCVSRSSDAGT